MMNDTIWLSKEEKKKIDHIILYNQKKYLEYESLYKYLLDEFFSSFSFEPKILKNIYQKMNQAEYQKNFFEDILSFCQKITDIYSSVLFQMENQILSQEGYFLLKKCYISFREVINYLFLGSRSIKLVFFMSYIYRSFEQIKQDTYWISCPKIEVDSKSSAALSFHTFKEVLDYSLIGEWDYEDYLFLSKHFKAIQMENAKVKEMDKNLFEDSLIHMARYFPDTLRYFDQETLLQLKGKIFTLIRDLPSKEVDDFVELVHKINKDYLK